MECQSSDDISAKLRGAISDFGKKLLLLGPLGQRESIYDDADYLAFAALKTALEGRWEVRSARIKDEDELDAQLSWSPAVVGITSTSPDHAQAIEAARKAARISDGKVLIIKGGAHEAACSRLTIANHPEIDVSFSGEADFSLPAFLDGGFPLGTTYREKGSVVSSTSLITQAQLNTIPLPSIDYLDASLRWGMFEGKSIARVLTQRGCCYHCNFCASSGGMRQYDVDTVISFIKEVALAGFQAIFFEDSTFTADREWTMHLLREIIHSGITIPKGAQTRMDRLDPEMIQLMKQAGFAYIFPGIESFDDNVLRGINKQIRVKTIINTLGKLRKAGIEYGVSVVRGFPKDSEEIFASTLDRLLELQPRYIFLECAKIYPGTYWSEVFGEKAVQKAYDKGIRETQGLQNPEDRGTLPFHNPSRESIQDKVREFTRSYGISRQALYKKYDRISAGCYRLK